MTTEVPEKSRTHQLVLFLGLFGAIVAGMALAFLAGPLLGGGERTARAAQSDYTITKGSGQIVGDHMEWTIQITGASQTSETIQFSDTYQPNGTGTAIIDVTYAEGPFEPIVICTMLGPDETSVDCSVQVFGNSATTLVIHTSLPPDQCGPQTVFNTAEAWGPLFDPFVVPGSPAQAVGIIPGDPSLCEQPIFQLCKTWDFQGVLADPRDFTFEVSDTSETRQVTINGVVEGGATECILISAPTGPVEVTEIVPSGFETPEVFVDGVQQDNGATAEFFLFFDECTTMQPNLVRAALVAQLAVNCVIAFDNTDTDDPPPTPGTPTPYVPGCINCRTPFVPTNTPVPPTNTPANTVVPPTSTIPSATQSTGLTDEQRTQTAVAGAKTAAALITPKPPATGSTPGGTSQGTNLLLVLVGLAMAAGGFGLVARRRR